MNINDEIIGKKEYGISQDSITDIENKLNRMKSALAYENNDLELELAKALAQQKLNLVQKQYDKQIKFINQQAKLEIKYREQINKAKEKEDDKELKRLEKRYNKELELFKKFQDAKEQIEDRKNKRQEQKNNVKSIFTESGLTMSERFNLLSSSSLSEIMGGLYDVIGEAFSNWTNKLNSQIDTIANYQGKWNTRLLGTDKDFSSISNTITGVVGLSPYVQQSKVMSSIDTLLEKGISYNVEQRAFLSTISEKIATTFDSANGTLLQLIRVQQADTTASRLGMENYLTTYLNSMYSSTEYLASNINDTVSSALYEATSQLSAEQGVAFEYQVQKWLGSLYSVGMSSSAISSIAQGLGYLGSGNVSALSSNSALQNLLVMSASKGGLNYSDLLQNGLTEQSTNTLMKSMVEFLSDIANSNKVVQSQYASIFGMSMSDISAVKNLSSSTNDIASSYLNYGGAISNLYNAMGTLNERTSVGEMMSNILSNTNYSIASGIASSPTMYALWNVSNMLSNIAGGLEFSLPLIMGTGTAQTFNIADLMKTGLIGTSLLSSIGSMVSAGSSGFDGASMLNALGLSNSSSSNIISRGTGVNVISRGKTVSQSSYIGNSNASDIQNSFITTTKDSNNASVAEAQAEDTSVTLENINQSVIKIYDLLNSLVSNNGLNVRILDYGLTNGFN